MGCWLPVVTRIDGLRSLRPLLDQSRNLIGAQAASGMKHLARSRACWSASWIRGPTSRHADLRDPMGKTPHQLSIAGTEARDESPPRFPDYGGMQVSTAKDSR